MPNSKIDKRKTGVVKKYNVSRTDGKKITWCLVMEIKDEHARKAMKTYADSVRSAGFNKLANDIEKQLDKYYEALAPIS